MYGKCFYLLSQFWQIACEYQPFTAQELLLSGTAAGLMAISVTKYVIGDRLGERSGIIKSLAIGTNLFLALRMKKNW